MGLHYLLPGARNWGWGVDFDPTPLPRVSIGQKSHGLCATGKMPSRSSWTLGLDWQASGAAAEKPQ